MFKRSKLHALLIVPVLIVLLAFTAQPVFATEFPQDDTIEADEIIDDDVIMSANNPTVLGTINGMLIITGDHIFIDGTVNGDVIAMGNYVEIGKNAHIAGNVIGSGYLVNIAGQIDGSFAGGAYAIHLDDSASIARNMYAGGYSVTITPQASVGMDAFIGSYQTAMHGDIGRDLQDGSGALYIDGSIGRNAIIDVESPGSNQGMPMSMMPFNQQNDSLPVEAQQYLPDQMDLGLTITDAAEIGGKITYVSPQPQSESIQVSPQGGIIYQTPVPDSDDQSTQQEPIVFRNADRGSFGFAAGMILTWVWRIVKAFITLLLIALLIFKLAPAKFDETVQNLRAKPLPSLGYGFLATIGGTIILGFIFVVLVCFTAFLAVITFGELGFYFFLIFFSAFFMVLALFLILTNLVSKIVVAYWVGSWLINVLSKSPESGRIMPLIVGLVIYIVLGFIPVLGWFVRYLVTIFGSGAIYITLLNWWRNRKTITA